VVAAAAIVLELKRPVPQQSSDWVDRQRDKVVRGVQELAQELDDKPWCNGEAY